jgi:hypothetical protein
MVKRKISKEDSGEKILLREEIIDDNDRILVVKNYEQEYNEQHFEYNSRGELIKETEFTGGEETSCTTYIFDENVRTAERRTFIAGELFEYEQNIETEEGLVNRTFQEDREIQKVIHKTEGRNHKSAFYKDGQLFEVHHGEFDSNENAEHSTLYDGEGIIIGIRKTCFNKDDEMIHYQEWDGNENLLLEEVYEYDNTNLIAESLKDYFENQYLIKKYAYDVKGNLISEETYDLNEKLTGYIKINYDEKNRVIMKTGLSSGNFDPVLGTSALAQKFNYTYEYETVEEN